MSDVERRIQADSDRWFSTIEQSVLPKNVRSRRRGLVASLSAAAAILVVLLAIGLGHRQTASNPPVPPFALQSGSTSVTGQQDPLLSTTAKQAASSASATKSQQQSGDQGPSRRWSSQPGTSVATTVFPSSTDPATAPTTLVSAGSFPAITPVSGGPGDNAISMPWKLLATNRAGSVLYITYVEGDGFCTVAAGSSVVETSDAVVLTLYSIDTKRSENCGASAVVGYASIELRGPLGNRKLVHAAVNGNWPPAIIGGP